MKTSRASPDCTARLGVKKEKREEKRSEEKRISVSGANRKHNGPSKWN